MAKYKIDEDYQLEVKDFMKSVIKKLKETTNEIDESWGAALTMLGDNYNTFILCRNQLKDDGLTVEDRFGVIQKHPLIKVQTDSQIQLVKLLQEFGLTLKSGKRLDIVDDVDEDSPLQQFVNKQNKTEKR